MAAPPLAPVPSRSTVHLLVLEDNPGDARLVATMLRDAPEIEIHQEERLAQALEHLASHATDAVLLDLGLPDSQGLETLRAVRRAAPHDPIVVLTGRDDEETAQAAVREGAQDYVTKSQVVGSALVRSIRYAVERQEHLRRMEHLTRVLRAIRGMNQLAGMEPDPDQLVRSACALLVAEHGYRAAWILLEKEGDVPWILAQAGWGEALQALAGEAQARRGPPCRAHVLGGEQVAAAAELAACCGGCPVRDACAPSGILVSALRDGGRVHGLLGVSPGREVSPIPEERELVAQVARDVAVALHGNALERSRRRSVAYARSLIEASLDPLVTISPEGKITDVNRATEEVTGVPRARIIGTDFADYFTDPEQARAAYRRVLEVGELRDCALTIRHAGGGTTEVLYNASRYCPSGVPEGVFAAARDVTERKRAEAERLRIAEQLLQSQKLEAVGRLAGGVAHDVNNVLTVILAATEYLLSQGWSPEARERVEEINEAAARAAALTRQLLIFTRKGVVEAKVLELNAVVASTDRMLRRLVGENVEMVTELDPATGRVRADPSHLEQVITNLVVNARDALPEGGRITIRTANAEVAAREGDSDLRPGPYVLLSVRDTGRGMSGDVLSHIFEPFFTTKPVGEGTGLGLSTVYAIVRRAGGGIRVASAPGAGTTFDVYLPREPALPDRAEPPGPSAAARGSEAILLVEDEPVLREREAEALQALGYEVVTACDGEEAARLVGARAAPFDLVVTDVVMPRLGGRELVARLRSGRPGQKVLFISGYSQPAPGPAPRGGEVPLLQKPFTPEQLARSVRELLDRS